MTTTMKGPDVAGDIRSAPAISDKQAPKADQIIRVRLVDNSDDVLQAWEVKKSALMQRSGCFQNAFGDECVDFQGNEIDLRHDDHRALNYFMMYVKTGSWQDALDATSLLWHVPQGARLMHDRAFVLFIVADKYDSQFLAQMCASKMRDAVSAIFTRSCMSSTPLNAALPKYYLTSDQQHDFLSLHYYPAVEVFGEYPSALWKVFALITKFCTWNNWRRRKDTNPIKDILLSNHQLAFCCMWREKQVNVWELREQYDDWLMDGDRNFLVKWGLEELADGVTNAQGMA